jgi:hypothetical protein
MAPQFNTRTCRWRPYERVECYHRKIDSIQDPQSVDRALPLVSGTPKNLTNMVSLDIRGPRSMHGGGARLAKHHEKIFHQGLRMARGASTSSFASRNFSVPGRQPVASFFVIKRAALSARAGFSASRGGSDEKYVLTTTVPACSPVICTAQSTPGRDAPVGCLK